MIRQQREMYERIENRLDAMTTFILKETILSWVVPKTTTYSEAINGDELNGGVDLKE